MNIETDNTYVVYRNEYDGRVVYSIIISRKMQNGSYDSAFIPAQFKKGVDIEDRTKICIKEGWISFFKTREGKAVFYIFINKFNVVSEDNNYTSIKTETSALNSLDEEISDEDLPF